MGVFSLISVFISKVDNLLTVYGRNFSLVRMKSLLLKRLVRVVITFRFHPKVGPSGHLKQKEGQDKKRKEKRVLVAFIFKKKKK